MKKIISIIILTFIGARTYTMDFSSILNPSSLQEFNQCLLPTTDHANYITKQTGWPQLNSPFNPIEDGALFKNSWFTSNAYKNNLKQQNFLFGVSSSAYQIEGGLDQFNETAQFYMKKGLQPAGKAIDAWNQYETDIKQMKNELGITSFRLSIAWDRIEPHQGIYNQEAIDRYATIMQTCKRVGIEPIVTLHQYTIPIWFAKLGGFEKSNNSIHFINFAKKIYSALCPYVRYWSTFNAPEAYAIKGYAKGENSPGIINNWQMVQEVLINMLDAHVTIYQAIKGNNGLYHQYKNDLDLEEPQIGIQKNIIMLDSSTKTFQHTCLSPITDACCKAGNMLQNDVFYAFFSSGNVDLWIPSQVSVKHSNPLAPQSLDWIGINFYSNMFMVVKDPQEETDPELRTENPRYRNYPEGIARAIEQVYSAIAQPLKIPIIITENGIATAHNNQGEVKRKRFFQRALFTIRILLERGYPIIGYLPWSSHDSYEWPTLEEPEPFMKRLFGFFAVNRNSYARTLKKSSEYYRDFIKGYSD